MQARETPVRILLRVNLDRDASGAELRSHGVQVVHPEIDHPLLSRITEVLRVRGERRIHRGPRFLLPRRVAVIIRHPSYSQVRAIPFRQALGVLCAKKQSANAVHFFQIDSCRAAMTRNRSWLRLFCFLFNALLAPWRYDATLPCVRDRLPQMFAVMSGNQEECAANRCVSPKHLLWVVQIRILDGQNSAAKMRERIFQRLNNFAFVARSRCNGLRINAARKRSAEPARNTVIRRSHMSVHFTDRANAFARAPGILLSRDGLG